MEVFCIDYSSTVVGALPALGFFDWQPGRHVSTPVKSLIAWDASHPG